MIKSIQELQKERDLIESAIKTLRKAEKVFYTIPRYPEFKQQDELSRAFSAFEFVLKSVYGHKILDIKEQLENENN